MWKERGRQEGETLGHQGKYSSALALRLNVIIEDAASQFLVRPILADAAVEATKMVSGSGDLIVSKAYADQTQGQRNVRVKLEKNCSAAYFSRLFRAVEAH